MTYKSAKVPTPKAPKLTKKAPVIQKPVPTHTFRPHPDGTGTCLSCGSPESNKQHG